MTTIKGQKFLTVYAEANDIYEIEYVKKPTYGLNILNDTDGDIQISIDGDFASNADETAGLYITLPSGAAANDLAVPFSTIYIKSAAAGNIVIERCG